MIASRGLSSARKGATIGVPATPVRSMEDDRIQVMRLGHPLLDDSLRWWPPGLGPTPGLPWPSIFFGVVAKPPAEVTAADVFGFLAAQRTYRHGSRVVRLVEVEAGLAARTIARRRSSVRDSYLYLCSGEDTGARDNSILSLGQAGATNRSLVTYLWVTEVSDTAHPSARSAGLDRPVDRRHHRLHGACATEGRRTARPIC